MLTTFIVISCIVLWMLIGAGVVALWNGWVEHHSDQWTDEALLGGLFWPVLLLIMLGYHIGVFFGKHYQNLIEGIQTWGKNQLKRQPKKCCHQEN